MLELQDRTRGSRPQEKNDTDTEAVQQSAELRTWCSRMLHMENKGKQQRRRTKLKVRERQRQKLPIMTVTQDFP